MQNSIGRDAYDEMVAKVGKQEADRQVRQYGWEITPTSEEQSADYGFKAIPASQVSNLLGEGGLSLAMGGGDNMEDEDFNVADEDVADDVAAGAYASLGPLTAMDLTDPKQISNAILANAAKQQQYYDNLANEIKQRRYGPSETEKLLALSSAFFAPTSVRGFSGTMGNVLPVLQKFGELRRTGEEKRTEALQGLAKQRATLAQGDIKTAIDLQRLMASYNKPQWVRTENKETGEVTLTPMYPNSNNAPSDGFPSINLEDLKTLVNNPENIPLPDLMAFFNKRYGENVAQKILGVK